MGIHVQQPQPYDIVSNTIQNAGIAGVPLRPTTSFGFRKATTR